MDNQVVVFRMGTEECGVSISSVESNLKMQAITSMPDDPAFVEGVTNLREKVLPVTDLRTRFGLPPQKVGKDSRIIIINANGLEVGMVLDGVTAELTIFAQSVEPPPALPSTSDSNFITGIARVDRRLVILLDLDHVLSSNEQDSPIAAV